MSHPFDMVVVGGTGDLARRKLFPSLYLLHRHGELSPAGRVVAVARQELSPEEFRGMVREGVEQEVKTGELDETVWQEFARRLTYVAAPTANAASYRALAPHLDDGDGRVRIFYLATSPELYGDLSQAFAGAGLVGEHLAHGGARIVLEKPIGHDLRSAEEINARVGEVFAEPQIYRIDHYLGKETVQNLMVLRFANALFEPLWRAEHIDHVQITVAERNGVQGRGEYYDRTGALRDMVQNHLLQLLCLVAMEPPARLEQEAIREEKIKVLRSLRRIEGPEVTRKAVRAQYRAGMVAGTAVPGYIAEEGIGAQSTTETFVALKAEIDNWRWAGVPFYLRTGKRMAYRVSEIIVQFRSVPHRIFGDRLGAIQDNRLVIRLQPDESVKLAMMVKSPGPSIRLKPVHLDLNLATTFEDRTPLAYERLLLDVIRGNATLFMHRSEVEAAWRWIEPILDGWQGLGERPRTYAAGSWGPEEAIAMMVRDERSWYEHLA